jgi:hypothetical protein
MIFVPIMIAGGLYYMATRGKPAVTVGLMGPTAAASIKLGQSVGVIPPAGASIISVGQGVPAIKIAPLAAAMAPAIAQVVAPAAVVPTAKAAAANILSDTPNTLAIVTQSVTPAIASVVPAASVPAAATATAANIVSAVPTTQASLAQAIAPTLLDTVHPDNVVNTANSAAAAVTSTLGAVHDQMQATIQPAVAAVVPSPAVGNAADAAVVSVMAGEAGSFMLNPRYMQTWNMGSDWDARTYAHPSQGDNGMWGGPHNNLYPPNEIHHAFGRGYSSTWGADIVEAKKKAGGGGKIALKPTAVGSTLYTIAWTDASGATKSTVVNITATP